MNRWSTRHKTALRRRKPASLRLGVGAKQRGVHILVRLLRKVRLRWLKLQYSCMLRKLKNHYKRLVKDLMEGCASLEVFQQRFFLEASFAAPVGVFSTIPTLRLS